MIVAIASIVTAFGSAISLIIQTMKLNQCTIQDCIPVKKCETTENNAIQQRILSTDKAESSSEISREAACEKSIAQWRDFSPTYQDTNHSETGDNHF